MRQLSVITNSQLEAVSREYCRIRTEQDGFPRDDTKVAEQMQIANVFSVWLRAFDTVLRPSRGMVEGDL